MFMFTKKYINQAYVRNCDGKRFDVAGSDW